MRHPESHAGSASRSNKLFTTQFVAFLTYSSFKGQFQGRPHGSPKIITTRKFNRHDGIDTEATSVLNQLCALFPVTQRSV